VRAFVVYGVACWRSSVLQKTGLFYFEVSMKRLSVDFWLNMYSEVHKGLLLDV
jgi:hypothetical protein